MPGIDEMVRAAEKALGLKEPNHIQKWYPGLSGNFPWCDAAVTYWAWHSGNQAAVTFGGHYAYTVAHAQAFQKHGKWHVDVAGIRRGDIVFFDWDKSNNIARIDHVGLVTSVSGKSVHTIEGNISDRCLRKVRDASTIVGYGRPAYTGKPGKPAEHEPFPGAKFFVTGKKSPVIAAMHKRLVAEGCNHYKPQANIDTWGSGDVASYAAWQRKCGFSGKDANGIPGETTWNKLRVPNV
ncbi:MAG: peptidoglycan-binding protein [Actinomadura sp.]